MAWFYAAEWPTFAPPLTALSGTSQYRTTGAPSTNPTPGHIVITANANATLNIRLEWAAYTQGARKADLLMLFWRKDGAAPTINDSAVSFPVNTTGASYYVFEGVNPSDTYSFAIAAARRTENGLEIGAIQAPTTTPPWRGVGGLTVNFTGQIDGTSASTIRANAIDPATVINQATTKIDPGKITISGAVTLDNWRTPNTTTIDGGKITTESISTGQLAANSITTRQLVLADWSNLHLNPNFEGASTEGWTGFNGTTSRASLASWAGDMPNENMARMDVIAGVSSTTAFNQTFNVVPGESYYSECWVVNNSGAAGVPASIYFRVFPSDGSGASPVTPNWVVLPDKEETKLVGTIVIPPNVSRLDAGVRIAQSASNGTAFFGGFVLRRMASAELIVDGAVTAGKLAVDSVTANAIKSGTITAGLLQAGAIGTGQLAAGAVTASKVAIGDTSNMVPDPTLTDTASWTGSAYTLSTSPAAFASTNYLRILPSAAAPQQVRSQAIPVEKSTAYHFSMMPFVSPAGAATAGAYVEWYSDVGLTAYISSQLIGASTAVAQTAQTVNLTSPANARRAVIVFSRLPATTNTGEARFANPVMRRAATGELIVDGAITAVKLAADSVTANAIKAGEITGVKIAANEIGADHLKTNSVTALKIEAGAITSEKITVNSLNGDRISAGTLAADKLVVVPNTVTHGAVALPVGITVGPGGTTIGSVASNAATGASDPVGRINAGTTQINPGKIVISGSTTLANWRAGSDATKIEGGSIAANTITANKLTVGMRGVVINGLNFTTNRVNVVSWAIGDINYYNDSNVFTTVGISAGSATWDGSNRLFIWWNKGSTVLNYGTTWFGNPDDILVAVYYGGVNVHATLGRTIIDGDYIKTGTIDANRLNVAQISAISSDIGTMQAGMIRNAAGTTKFDVSNGHIIFNNGSFMTVKGNGFGSGNQFLEWSGPAQANLSSCTESNAISFLKTNGQAYYAGGIIAGTLKTSMANSGLGTSATATTGLIGSNGNSVTVNGSYAMQSTYTNTYPATTEGVNNYNAAITAFGSATTTDGGFSHEGTKANNPTSGFTLTVKRDGASLTTHTNINGSISILGVRPVAGDAPGTLTYTYDFWSAVTTADPYINTNNRTYSAEFSRSFSASGTITWQRVSVTSTEW
jgi:hypothetical protein